MQNIDIYKNSYLIIGGPNTNKSIISRLLSKKLKYKLINLDREKYSYFELFTDFDSSKYYNITEKYGNIKALNYIHKYEMKHLNYVLDNIDKNVVIDFGNTYLIIDSKDIINKMKLFKNIVLLYSNKVDNNELNNKLNRNELLIRLSTIKINIDDKSINDIINIIENNKEFKEIL